MKKYILAIITLGLLTYGFIALIRWDPQAQNVSTTSSGLTENVSTKDGVQYINLTAKGGYAPGKTIAQADVPTVLQVNTNGTFDCSSALTIPKKNVSELLPPSGVTDIDLGTPVAGMLEGTCSMGMYGFTIDFQEL